MYLGKRKNWQTEESNENRKEIIKSKSGAAWNTFLELEKIISEGEFAKQYLGHTKKWFVNKISNCGLHNNEAFTEEEYTLVVESLRDIAKRLLAHADEIEAAEIFIFEKEK